MPPQAEGGRHTGLLIISLLVATHIRSHSMKITVETTVAAPIEDVWRAWTTPDDIMQWNAASDDWHTTNATVDLRVGGIFSSRMEAKDGSMGFDFAGTYTNTTFSFKGELGWRKIAVSVYDGVRFQ
jgi:Activator of Hsp90 ATPase homolog 1-like protein